MASKAASVPLFSRVRAHAHLFKYVLILAAPVLVAFFLQNLLAIVDTKMVGALGEGPIAALSLSRPLLFMISAMFMGLAGGTNAYAARAYGAGDMPMYRRYVTQSLVLAVYISILVGGALIWFRLPLIRAMGPDEAVARLASDFMFVMLAGLTAVGVSSITVQAFNSVSLTAYPMYFLIANNVFNYAGNAFFIPRLAVAGSGLSTVLTTLIVDLVQLGVLMKLRLVEFTRRVFEQSLRTYWNLLGLGVPSALQMIIRSLASIVLFKIISMVPSKTTGAAALGVGLQAEALAFMPCIALAVSASIIVGQSLGGNDPAMARRGALISLLYGIVFMTVMAAAFIIFAPEFVGFFIHNAPDVIESGSWYLRINAISEPFLAVSMILSGALRGAGDVNVPLGFSLFALWGIRLPLAYYLTVVLGLPHFNGIWIAMTTSVIIESMLIAARFAQGRWTKIVLA